MVTRAQGAELLSAMSTNSSRKLYTTAVIAREIKELNQYSIIYYLLFQYPIDKWLCG